MNETEIPPGARVRGLMRRAERTSLATLLARDDSARPYGSLVLSALDHDASPLLLLSDLADHSRNLAKDDRVSLLYDGTQGWQDPLAGPRACVLGRAAPCDDPRLIARFVARHPGAAVYVGFADFKLYRVALEQAHLVAGFGTIHWLEADQVRFDAGPCAALAAAEADILSHMNQDHGQALDLMAQALLQRAGDGWRQVGIDPEGCDLWRDGALARLDFDQVVQGPDGARAALVALTRRARAAAKGAPE